MSAEGFIILGNQLFPLNHIKKYKSCHFFMAEDYELCSYFKFHKHKLIFFLASMRSYKDSLVKEGLKCHYEKLDEQKRDNNYEKKLKIFIKLNNIKKLKVFDIPDSFFRKRIFKFCSSNKLDLEIIKSPMFMTDQSLIDEYFSKNKKLVESNIKVFFLIWLFVIFCETPAFSCSSLANLSTSVYPLITVLSS